MYLLLSISLLMAFTIFTLQLKLEGIYAQLREGPTTLYIPPAHILKRVALGYDRLVSDFYWLLAIQYYGEEKNARENYRWLYPLMDLVTQMDPKFLYAYKFAGVAIPYDAASARNANKILEKGMREAPQNWQFPFYMGFNYYTYMNDYEGAARYISSASQLPGAPPFLAGLASRLYAEAGRPELAIEFLIEIYNSLEDELLKRELERRIKEAVVERDLNLLNEAVARFRSIKGRPPESLSELVTAGIIKRIPPEPFGGRYYYNPIKGEVMSTMVKRRLRLYREGEG